MKVQFKQPVDFEGVVYRPNVINEFPDRLAKHWYFLALLNNGVASVASAPKKSVAVVEAAKKAPAVKKPSESLEKLKTDELEGEFEDEELQDADVDLEGELESLDADESSDEDILLDESDLGLDDDAIEAPKAKPKKKKAVKKKKGKK